MALLPLTVELLATSDFCAALIGFEDPSTQFLIGGVTPMYGAMAPITRILENYLNVRSPLKADTSEHCGGVCFVAMRAPAFFAYSDNYLIDVKSGIIMDVEASRAIRQAEVTADLRNKSAKGRLMHRSN
jgi:hypothetical protein